MESVFFNAYKSINEHPEHSLRLSVRREVLFTLGEIESETNQENFTHGKKLRAMLALRCVEKIMPLWYLAFPDDHRFDDFISQIRKYINSPCGNEHKYQAEELRKTLDAFCCEIDNIGDKPELFMLILVLSTLIHTAGVALVDEEILDTAFENADNEESNSNEPSSGDEVAE